MKHLLITGATGFIGYSYVQSLITEGVEITIISREESFEKTKSLFPEVNVLCLDLDKGDFSDFDMRELSSVTDVVHIAGGYNIEMSFKEAYESNILVSQNLIHLIEKLKTPPMIHLISSFSVVGNKNNQTYSEDDLCLNEKRMSSYSYSKAKVEEAFRSFSQRTKIKIRIYRPGIVIETRENKLMPKIDGPYYFSKALLKLKGLIKPMVFLALPFSKNASLPLVSIESLTKDLTNMTLNPETEKLVSCYYLLPETQVSVEDLIQAFFKNLEIKTKLIALPKLNGLQKITNLFGVPDELFDFMFMKNTYAFSNMKKDFPQMDIENPCPNDLARKILTSTPKKEMEVTNA